MRLSKVVGRAGGERLDACVQCLTLSLILSMSTAQKLLWRADIALVLDHGSHIFIWLGSSHAGPGGSAGGAQTNGWTRDVVEAAAQGFVAGLAEGRFPVPEVRLAVEVPLPFAASPVVCSSACGASMCSLYPTAGRSALHTPAVRQFQDNIICVAVATSASMSTSI